MPKLNQELINSSKTVPGSSVFGSMSMSSDKYLAKLMNDLEKFMKKLTKIKDFWNRDVLNFLGVPA